MISLLSEYRYVNDAAPFFVDCPWCGHKSMDQVDCGRSRVGTYETLFGCPECYGSAIFRWAKDAPTRRLCVRDRPPEKDDLAKALNRKAGKPDSSAQGIPPAAPPQ